MGAQREAGVRRRVARALVFVIVAVLRAPLAGAGAVVVALRTADGDPVALAEDGATPIAVGTLYSLSAVIPLTDAAALTCDITIQGRPWDNDQILPLQPMNKLLWVLVREDGEVVKAEDALDTATAGICRFEAVGIFRATESGTYRIDVRYGDETLAEPLVLTYLFDATQERSRP
jgi:hypothetical protein